jgi:hypothetical protein
MIEQTKAQGEWVILEAMGHQRVAGMYYFENGLHRVDVPDINDPTQFVRTERYGNDAIFRITSVEQEAALLVAATNIIPEAIPWQIRHNLKQLVSANEPVEAGESDSYDEPEF